MLKLIFLYYLGCQYYISSFKTKIKFLSALSFVLSFVVFTGNTYNLDYMTYYWDYTHQDFDTLDKAVSAFYVEFLLDRTRLSSNAYGTSKVWCWLFWRLCIRSITNNYNVFWALYFFAQQFIDVIQFRNYIATVFLMGSLFLLKNGKRWMSFFDTDWSSRIS